jgi:hypothetical protein
MPKIYNRENDQFSWEYGRESDRNGDTDQGRRQKFRTRSLICVDIFDHFNPTREGHNGDAEASRGQGDSEDSDYFNLPWILTFQKPAIC